jgi:hypothetical protein
MDYWIVGLLNFEHSTSNIQPQKCACGVAQGNKAACVQAKSA